MWVVGQRHAPAGLLPGTHWVGGRVGPRKVWKFTENLALTGIRTRTAQSLASRYTDRAVPAHT